MNFNYVADDGKRRALFRIFINQNSWRSASSVMFLAPAVGRGWSKIAIVRTQLLGDTDGIR